MTRTIAIVGGGLSGSLTALHLMRRAARDDLRILLFNRSGRLARGLAYGTRSAAHLLNVPAARMSALADDPLHFLRYAQREEPRLEPGSFVRREVYGDYLEALLRSTQAQMAEPGRFEHHGVAIDDLTHDARGARLQGPGGASWTAERVVLALGHFAPAEPELPGSLRLAESACYVGDPWAAGALERIDRQCPVLLLGSGLTMVDIALALHDRGCTRLHALSRRGLLPHTHREHGAAPLGLAPLLELQAGEPRLCAWLALLRAHCREQATLGIGWREVLASLRSSTPALWQRLDDRQRRQFLRHLQPYWEVHRHRLAPASAERLQALIDAGTLRLHAGRVLAIDAAAGGLRLRYRVRGGSAERTLQAGTLVNCTGPSTRLATLGQPLLESLLARGLLVPDALGLGIAVDDDLAMLRADGRASKVLHYIGPFLRARYWECTAVPELRAHAERLAATLCAAEPVALAA